MPIHFNCAVCKKALFAQSQFAGRSVVCPGCNARNTIPNHDDPLRAADPALIDMEIAPEAVQLQGALTPAAPVLAQISAAAPTPEIATPAPNQTLETASIAAAPENSAAGPEPVKRCPMCAETIKLAAKKCRYCGSILDESLRREEEQQRQANAVDELLVRAERSTRVWRAIGIIITGCTVGWLLLLTVGLLGRPQVPGSLIFFNILLIVGLVWSSRQMREGPFNVFLAASFAVLLCMPLNVALGLPFDHETYKDIQTQYPNVYKNWTEEQFTMVTNFFYYIIGFAFSLPLWIATLKVAAFQRLRSRLGKSA